MTSAMYRVGRNKCYRCSSFSAAQNCKSCVCTLIRLHGTHCHLTFVLQPALLCSRNYSKRTF